MPPSSPKPSGNLLIRNATVCTLDEERRILHKSAVAIGDGRILAVGDTPKLDARYPEFSTYDAAGKAVLPGFINSHTHTVLLVLRGTVEDMDGNVVYGYIPMRLTTMAALRDWLPGSR